MSSVAVDIGATNIRFARLSASGRAGQIAKFATSEFPDLKTALAHFLKLEGGHTSLSPLTEKEVAVWQFLLERYGRVSVERVLSGPGIVELYTALGSLEGRETGVLRPEDIASLAIRGESSLAVETLEIFCAWLGDVAGDVALMYLARGGLYLAGDILLTILEILKRSRFRSRFENKGRGAGVVAAIPTFLISVGAPVLQGCTYLLNDSA